LQFSEHEIRKFLTSTYFEKNTMIDKYNIFDCGHTSPDNYPKCNYKFWNMPLSVNSYNIKNPNISYVKDFELSSKLHILCEDENGDNFHVIYRLHIVR